MHYIISFGLMATKDLGSAHLALITTFFLTNIFVKHILVKKNS